MAITEYTTPDSVRAILGVSDDELEDEVIGNAVYTTLLDEALLDLSPTLPANFKVVQEQDTKTSDEARFVARVQTWSAYFLANLLLTSAETFSPQILKSEKDAFERVVDPFAHLREDVPGMMEYLRAKIDASYAILFPAEDIADSATVRILVVNAGLGTDPVTGV